MERLSRIARTLLAHRRRFAPAVLVVAVVVVGGQLSRAAPRETRVRYALGPDHARVTEASIDYVAGGDEVAGVRFHYGQGAPAVVRHKVDLAPGRYRVVVELRGPSFRRSVQRALRVPADGVVRIDLRDEMEPSLPAASGAVVQAGGP